MDPTYLESADEMRATIERGAHDPTSFRAAILGVPRIDRDAWLDRVLGLAEIPDDDPNLPSGCVPYLPCAVEVLLRVVEQASPQPSDVFVDIGAGLGRASAFVHLVTGASVINLEIQPQLVRAARELATRLLISKMSFIEGDATNLVTHLTSGTIFFLYCPFSGARLAQVVAGLEAIARIKTIRVCCVDLPLPTCDWLVAEGPVAGDLAIYRSTL
ncbi:MAG: class I SAM-dependent methyltransferase [Polyangiaceae bacterium]